MRLKKQFIWGCVAPGTLLLMYGSVTSRGGIDETVPSSRGKEEDTMRRIAMLVSLVVVVLALLGAGAVWAQDQIIHCHAIPCYGSGNYDLIYERPGNGLNDRIIMRGGDDRVLATRYTNDFDVTLGGSGDDRLEVNDGDTHDTASGGPGRDLCIVDSRAEVGRGCAAVRVR